MKNKKLDISATGNNGIRHYYTFHKNRNTKEGFIDFMTKLGFENEKIESRFSWREEDPKTGEEKIYFFGMKDLVDECWYYQNKNYELDIFWGKKKLIIVVRTKQKRKIDRRVELVDAVLKSSKWLSKEELELKKEKSLPKKIKTTIKN